MDPNIAESSAQDSRQLEPLASVNSGEDENIEATLTDLQQRMDLVRRGVDFDALSRGISSLQNALDDETYSEELSSLIRCHYMRAILTRYGIYGWIDDLDGCFFLDWEDIQSNIELLMEFAAAGQQSGENIFEVQAAVQLIQASRKSLNTNALNAIISTAAEALTGSTSPIHKADLLIIHAKTLVMKYLHDNDPLHLNEATTKCQEAERISAQTGHGPLTYMSLVLLAHIECLRLLERGEMERSHQVCDYVTRAHEADEAGRNSFDMAMQMLQDGIDITQLQEAIESLTASLHERIAPHPRRLLSLHQLAEILLARFELSGDFHDMEECILLRQEEVDMLPAPHLDRSVALENLAKAFLARFDQTDDPQDLEKCIQIRREANALQPDYAPARNNLANVISVRFNHLGAFEDLDESITLYREATKLEPTVHLDRPSLLNNLASALATRFNQKGIQEGIFQDLDESIVLIQEALDLPIQSLSHRLILFNNLGEALYTRFREKGALQDLEECIAMYREALAIPDSDTIMSLNDIAAALLSRFECRGAPEDLEECITLHRKVLDSQPVSDPDRSMSLINLASALSTRFEDSGALPDLEECIVLQREALDLRPAPHPDQPSALYGLADSLYSRFQQSGALEDLEEGIRLHQEALDLRSNPHPERFQSLNSLARLLCARFERKGTPQDLDRCIALHQQALDLQSPQHPHRAFSFNNLADALLKRYKWKHASRDQSDPSTSSNTSFDNPEQTRRLPDDYITDLENAFYYIEAAAKHPTAPLIYRLIMSKNWVECAQTYRPALLLDAYKWCINLLPQLASFDLTLKQRQEVLKHSRNLTGDAARCAIEANQCDLAVVYLSTGRSIFWSQALQLRTPAERLGFTHPDLAEKLIYTSKKLEQASYLKPGPQHVPAGSTSSTTEIGTRYRSLYDVVDQRKKTIDEIRQIPGYEGFLQLPSISYLQTAADGGPIIMLNASERGCDALILSIRGPIKRVCLEIQLKELSELKSLSDTLLTAAMRTTEISQDATDVLGKLLGRDMVAKSTPDSNQAAFRSFLESLWVKVVHPVLNALEIVKTDSLNRIWWCPTGPFASLPIHAAGLYSEDNQPINCVFQYAVSSYCTSPQDLLHPPPQIPEDFRMTVIIEPEAPGASALPATRQELSEIEKHVQNGRLLTHVGSMDISNQTNDLLTDIQQSSFVHFGCHGMQDLTNPLESYLLLSSGKLSMSRIIEECKVPEGALAYLSACETAKGDEVRPDESLNLVATMMFAGFRSVVGTLWYIFDDDAPVVADVFYRYLFRNGNDTGPDVRDAAYGLHLATMELRERGKSFNNWVPYVHYGI